MCTRLRLVNFTLLDGPNEVLLHIPPGEVCSWLSSRWQGNYGMQKGRRNASLHHMDQPRSGLKGGLSWADTVKVALQPSKSFTPLRNSSVYVLTLHQWVKTRKLFWGEIINWLLWNIGFVFRLLDWKKRTILWSVSILIDRTDRKTDRCIDRCVDVVTDCPLDALLALQVIWWNLVAE